MCVSQTLRHDRERVRYRESTSDVALADKTEKQKNFRCAPKYFRSMSLHATAKSITKTK